MPTRGKSCFTASGGGTSSLKNIFRHRNTARLPHFPCFKLSLCANPLLNSYFAKLGSKNQIEMATNVSAIGVGTNPQMDSAPSSSGVAAQSSTVVKHDEENSINWENPLTDRENPPTDRENPP